MTTEERYDVFEHVDRLRGKVIRSLRDYEDAVPALDSENRRAYERRTNHAETLDEMAGHIFGVQVPLFGGGR